MHISIKVKLFFLPILIIFSFIIMFFLMYSNFQRFNDKADKASYANKMIKNILKARIAEKNYNRRKDEKYTVTLKNYLQENIEIATNLAEEFEQPDNKMLAKQTKELFENYLLSFNKYQKIRDKSLSAEGDMIKEARDVESFALQARSVQKQQRSQLVEEKAPLQKIIDKIEKASLTNKIIKELNEVRISEKNYIRRKDAQYKKTIEDKIQSIYKITDILRDDFKDPKNKNMVERIKFSLDEYKKAFDGFAYLREQSFALSEKMKQYARDAEELAILMRKDQKQERAKLEDTFNMTMTFLFFIIGFIMLFTTLYIANTISKGIDKILRATLDVINGKERKEITVDSTDELGELAKSFNSMINKIDEQITNLDSIVDDKTKELKEKITLIEETQNMLVENEKMAALGSLVAGVAHEINTPIGNSYTSSTYVLDELHQLKKKYDEGKMTKSTLEGFLEEGNTLLFSIKSNLERASQLIQSFKKIAVDSSSDHITRINLKEYTKDILLSTKTMIKHTDINIVLDAQKNIDIKINPGDYSQVLTNLIQNAVIHAYKDPKKGTITISLKKNDSFLVISVCDDGVGISKENSEQIFNPFFTTNREHGGSGLGLNIIHNIILKSFKGTIKCVSELEKGTCFIIKIPINKDEAYE